MRCVDERQIWQASIVTVMYGMYTYVTNRKKASDTLSV